MMSTIATTAVGDQAHARDRALPLASYKLRLHEQHIRAMPERGLDDMVFRGPGVDLRGEDATAILTAMQPMLAWLDAREPGVVVRSISVRTSPPRVLVSLGPLGADARPRAIRFESPFADELRSLALSAEKLLSAACARVLAKRLTSLAREPEA